jgi:6-pyruvoyl-tetrahydropterin synthase
MGHRIVGLKHKKEDTLHGHSVEFEVMLELLTNKIFDTNELKRRIKPLIDKLDHSFLIWENDPLKKQIISLAKNGDFGEKIIIVKENPTIEYLAKFLYENIQKRLPLKNDYKLKIVVKIATLKSVYYE